MKTAFYYEKNGDLIFMKCEKNAIIPQMKTVQDKVKFKVNYPESSLKYYNEGNVLVKFVIGVDGLAKEIELIKGVDSEIDKTVLAFFESFKTKKQWFAGKHKNEKITQEIIVPFNFSINGITKKYNNNFYFHMPSLQYNSVTGGVSFY